MLIEGSWHRIIRVTDGIILIEMHVLVISVALVQVDLGELFRGGNHRTEAPIDMETEVRIWNLFIIHSVLSSDIRQQSDDVGFVVVH